MEIRYVQRGDRAFWFRLDRHLPPDGFEQKVRDQQGYVLLEEGAPVGLLRFHLFWDSIPFCTMLFVEKKHRGKGCGSALMRHWESDMRAQGYDMLLTSTRVDEEAQHFYRMLGYKDCGGLVIEHPRHAQPMELFLVKEI